MKRYFIVDTERHERGSIMAVVETDRTDDLTYKVGFSTKTWLNYYGEAAANEWEIDKAIEVDVAKLDDTDKANAVEAVIFDDEDAQ